jgi:phosphoglycerate dehydrogenase-like enzyme
VQVLCIRAGQGRAGPVEAGRGRVTAPTHGPATVTRVTLHAVSSPALPRRVVCPSGEGGLSALFDAPGLRDRLAALGDVTVHHDQPDEAALVARVRDADVVLLTTHLPESALRACAAGTRPGVPRVIAFTGTGVASYVDLPLARELGVTVTNVTGYGDRAVAEHALALLLAAARGLPAADRAVRAGDWTGFPGTELAGATVGVLGLGGIGRTFAGMVRALGMAVLAWDRRADDADLARLGAERAPDLATVFARADVVSLHLPLTPQTRHLVGAAELDLLRPGAILVNTARGELLAPGALAARLSRGDVVAALDVFDPEPLGPDDPLLAAPGTVLTPHLGFRTPQALARMVEGCVSAVEAFCAGTPVRVVT